ncbi:MAG: hypothetical protein ABI488_07390 [Polyangiaceae bacterium]
MLGIGLGGAALCATPACNAILGNEEGHRAASGGSGGTVASAGTAASSATAGSPSGGSPSGGSPSGGSPSGGSPSGGSPSGGSPSGGGAAGGGSASGGASSGGIGGNGGASGTAGAGGGTLSPSCSGTVRECGGNLVGTWVIQSSCVILPSANPTIPSQCNGADMYQRYKVTGNVTYTDKTWTEDYTEDTLETITYSASCITAFHKMDSTFPAPASVANCGMIASNLGASSASCLFVNNGCNCALTFTEQGTTGDSYAKISNSEYTNSKDDGQPVSYCVQTVGGVTTLTTSQQTLSDYTFERVFTLSSR